MGVRVWLLFVVLRFFGVGLGVEVVVLVFRGRGEVLVGDGKGSFLNVEFEIISFRGCCGGSKSWG